MWIKIKLSTHYVNNFLFHVEPCVGGVSMAGYVDNFFWICQNVSRGLHTAQSPTSVFHPHTLSHNTPLFTPFYVWQ